ncbi:hypothetical protein ACFL6M_07835, partial [Candidatus Eisenbacteria bacterium]
MKPAALVLVLLAFCNVTPSADPPWRGIERPEKGDEHITGVPVGGDQIAGDTIEEAWVVAGLPFTGTGNTCLFNNDYDEVCPYVGSVSPDVVYAYAPSVDQLLIVDLCGGFPASYDTKTYVYEDAEGNLVKCDDDGCGSALGYASYIHNAELSADHIYYIVVDGFGGDCGDYVLKLYEGTECVVECPPGATLEGEPPLVDGYVDNHNGGCISTPPIFQTICDLEFCGRGGTYSVGPQDIRDMDWLIVHGDGTPMSVTITAEEPTTLWQLGFYPALRCDSTITVDQTLAAEPCVSSTMDLVGGLEEEVWIWVASSAYSDVPEYTYTLTFEGIDCGWGIACCFGNECRIVADGVTCYGSGGIPHPEQSTCDPNPCYTYQGACCLGDFECTIMSEDECLQYAGIYFGEDDCLPGQCHPDGPPCPNGGIDYFAYTHTAFFFEVPGLLDRLPVVAGGPTTVERSVPDFLPDGHCEIQTEIIYLSLLGTYNPGGEGVGGEGRLVEIVLDPLRPTFGTIISSDDGMGNPDYPDTSEFTVNVLIMIEEVGTYPHSIDLGNLLQSGDLWGDPPCVDPEGPYQSPSNDHAHIPCPPGDPPTGCCVLQSGGCFVTYAQLCGLLDGTYMGDGVPCPGACCIDEQCVMTTASDCAQ